MDTEELSKEEQCENLMNIVVESRKRFGKMCVDYHQKSSLMENKLLNLQLETISSYRFKAKNPIPDVNVENMNTDVDDFAVEIIERQKRIEMLRKKVKDTEGMVLQLKGDSIGKKVYQPITAEAMLKLAKEKKMINK